MSRPARLCAFEEDAYRTCPVNVTPSPTPSAADAVTGLSTVNTKVRDRIPRRIFDVLSVGFPQPVANAATQVPSCARTSGVRRPSEERPPVLEGCDTLKRFRDDSRTDLGALPDNASYYPKPINDDLRENTVAKKKTAKPAES